MTKPRRGSKPLERDVLAEAESCRRMMLLVSASHSFSDDKAVAARAASEALDRVAEAYTGDATHFHAKNHSTS